jgi:hypothetical protein
LFGFLHQYCTPDVHQTTHKYTYDKQPYTINLHGPTAIAMHLSSVQHLSTDLVQRIDSTEIYYGVNTNRSKIVSHFSIDLTRMYDTKIDDVVIRAEDAPSVVTHSIITVGDKRHSSSFNSHADISSQLSALQDRIDDIQVKLVPRDEPISVTIRGEMTMWTGEDYKINRIVTQFDPNVSLICS